MQQQCCFAPGVDAHPCFSPSSNWTNRLLQWRNEWLRVTVNTWVIYSGKYFLLVLIINRLPLYPVSVCSGIGLHCIFYAINVVILICPTNEACEVISLVAKHSGYHSFIHVFSSLCSGCCGIIFLHTELFLGPASCVDSAPFFPSQYHS